MYWKTESFDKSILKNHEEMIVLTKDDSPGFYSVLAYDKEEGFTGASIILHGDLSVEEIVRALDTSDQQVFQRLSFVSTEPTNDWLSLGSKINNYYDPQAYSDFVKKYLDPRVIDMINDRWILSKCSREGELTAFDVASFFATGDREARYQATKALPASTAAIIKSKSLRSVIDSRDQITPALMVELDIDKRQMRSLLIAEKILNQEYNQDKKLELNGLVANYSPGKLARWLGKLNNTQLPRDLSELAGYVKLADSIDKKGKMKNVSTLAFDRLIKGLKSDDLPTSVDLLSFKVRVADRNNASTEPKVVTRSYYDGPQMDFIARLEKVLLAADYVNNIRVSAPDILAKGQAAAHKAWNDQPLEAEEAEILKAFTMSINAILYTGDGMKTRKFITEQFSLTDLRSLEERWHHTQATLDNDSLSIDAEVDWKTLVGSVDLPDDIVAREINSSSWLSQQGRKENHCVGGYTGTVLGATGQSADLIFSMEQKGKILSTVHISLKIHTDWRGRVEGSTFKIIQHQAKGNSTPSALADKAVKQLIENLGDLTIESQLSYIQNIRTNSKQVTTELNKAILGIQANIFNPNLPEAILGIHERVLPPALRKLSIDEITAKFDAFLAENYPADNPAENLTRASRQAEELIRNIAKSQTKSSDAEMAL